ncbi:hypothetical protein MJG53_005698 [Ovis ammon polii x Ovis aries]|uniref:Uncharacterized protein n=1 Tax=Ovis ammon polii x Ovis aries TaxID=2918886 RepID=A0ACB9V6T2_9CETA|nr:hypothetical protein MJG53_005698 [Ovis ammon polii x Ovis aries]
MFCSQQSDRLPGSPVWHDFRNDQKPQGDLISFLPFSRLEGGKKQLTWFYGNDLQIVQIGSIWHRKQYPNLDFNKGESEKEEGERSFSTRFLLIGSGILSLRTQNGQGNSQGEAASRWDPEDWIGITRSGGLMTKAKGRGVPWLVWNRFSILVPIEDLKSRWSLTQHRKALSVERAGRISGFPTAALESASGRAFSRPLWYTAIDQYPAEVTSHLDRFSQCENHTIFHITWWTKPQVLESLARL